MVHLGLFSGSPLGVDHEIAAYGQACTAVCVITCHVKWTESLPKPILPSFNHYSLSLLTKSPNKYTHSRIHSPQQNGLTALDIADAAASDPTSPDDGGDGDYDGVCKMLRGHMQGPIEAQV